MVFAGEVGFLNGKSTSLIIGLYGEMAMKQVKVISRMIGLSVWALLLSNPLLAQNKVFQVQADYAAFRYQGDRLNWELYYSIFFSNPQYQQIENNAYQWLGGVNLKITQGESVVLDEKWKVQGTAIDLSEGVPPVSIVDKISYVMKAGSYQVKIKVYDLNDPATLDSTSFDMDLKATPAQKVSISDIQLASQIQRGAQDRSNPFYKNTLLVIPNPSLVYGTNTGVLFFYAETYHLMQLGQGANYTFSYQVTNTDGLPVPTITEKEIRRRVSVEASVETGMVRVDSLQSGSYYLRVKLTDSDKNVVTEQKKLFFVYNPNVKAADLQANIDYESLFQVSEFAEMPKEKVDQEIDYVHYIMTSEEMSAINLITEVDQRRLWLFKFWKRRDSDIATPINEARVEYLKRVEHCNQKFSAFKKEGWSTDRGRVYLIYGEPSYITNFPNEKNMRPYIIWRYDSLQNGVDFVFVDFHRNRLYQLVHSNLLGEIHNIDWQKMATKGFY